MFGRAREGDLGTLEMVREARVIYSGVPAISAPQELQRQVQSCLKQGKGFQTCSDQKGLSNYLAIETK